MKIHHVCLVLAGILLTGCISDDDSSVLPTQFSGRILYSDTMEPVPNIEIEIGPQKRRFPVNIFFPAQRFTPENDGDGSFNVSFEGNGDIDLFRINVTITDENGIILNSFNEFNGLVCSPEECNDYEPGRSHENLLILVPRE
ncbi:MAG: hypothetical protein AAF348_19255 [Bacteroidota bacterium]